MCSRNVENRPLTRQLKRQLSFDSSRPLTDCSSVPSSPETTMAKTKRAKINNTTVLIKSNKKQKKKCFKNQTKNNKSLQDTLVLSRRKQKRGRANLTKTILSKKDVKEETKTPRKRKNSTPLKWSNDRWSGIVDKIKMVCSTPIGPGSDDTIDFENETPIQPLTRSKTVNNNLLNPKKPCDSSTNNLEDSTGDSNVINLQDSDNTTIINPKICNLQSSSTPTAKVQKIQDIVNDIKDLLAGKDPKPSEPIICIDETLPTPPVEVIEINDEVVDLTSTQEPIIVLDDTEANTVINVDDLTVLDATGSCTFRNQPLPAFPVPINEIPDLIPLKRKKGSKLTVPLSAKKEKRAKRKNRLKERPKRLATQFSVVPTDKLNLNFTTTAQDSEFVTRAIMLANESVRHSARNPSPLKVSKVGRNIYNPGNNQKEGLRLIVIDGSNVAIGHLNGKGFSCEGLKICIDFFAKRGHEVKAFVPQYRRNQNQSSNPSLLETLAREGLVIFTPSRRVNGRMIVPYDDRYIVQCAAEREGIIVSNDNYRDLLSENPSWRETIERRLLMWTWCGDMIMFPMDPCGRYGPSLESFLRF